MAETSKTPENIRCAIAEWAERNVVNDGDLMKQVATDSLHHYEILLGLEDTFRVCIKDRDYYRAETVGDIVNLVMNSK